MASNEIIWESKETQRERGQPGWERVQSLEEDLRTLQFLIPNIGKDLHAIFEEAVTDTLGSMLPMKEARSVMRLIGRMDLVDPSEVYSTLDFILRDGSRTLKGAIREEFCVNVHLLNEKVIRGFVPDAVVSA